MEHTALTQVLILLSLSVVAVVALRRIHLPPVLAYLFVGMLAGPHALGWVPASDLLHLLAEIGVVFLLFMIGLEFSLAQFWSLRRAVLGLGGAQVVLTALAGGAIAWWSGLSPAGALVIGGTVALSSTAIVVKQLIEQLEMHSRHGRLALAVLLFQDIAVVPFLVIIPLLAQGDGGGIALPLLLALGKAIVAVTAILALGHWLIRPLFHQVAAAHSTELFTLTALLVSLTAAWLTFELGLSLALGAFLAGMLLSETEFKHQIEIDIRPFRDILMGVFFISVGAHLDVSALPDIWLTVLSLTVALIIGKGFIVAAISRAMGYESGVALRTGMVLANGGEFGFALLTLALANRLLTPAETQPVLLAVVFSMVLAPLLVKYNGAAARKLFARSYLRGVHLQAQQVEEAAREIQRHVVFCGFGRIGQNLAAFLRPEGIDYIALDLDPHLVKEAWEAGERVFYGDSTHADVLRAADVERARMVLVTFDDAGTCEKIIRQVRQLAPQVPIFVRTRDDTSMERLENAGATRVIPETLEASMMLSRLMLQELNVDDAEINRLVEAARDDHYHTLRGFFHGQEAETLAEAERPRLHTVTLAPSDSAVGRRIGELDFGKSAIAITAICRAGLRGEQPEPETRLVAGDAVIIEGSAEALEHAESVLRSG